MVTIGCGRFVQLNIMPQEFSTMYLWQICETRRLN